MSEKRGMTPEEYYKLRQEEIRDDQLSNRISLISATLGLGKDELGLIATIGIDMFTPIKSLIKNDTLAENGSNFLDAVGATGDYFINLTLEENSGKKAYQKVIQNARSKASQQKKPKKNKIMSIGRKEARVARDQAKKNFKKIPIYSSVKLIEGIATQMNTEYDLNDHLVEYDGDVGSGEFEKAMADVRLSEKKSDDFDINVVANGAAVVTDYYTKGTGGNFVRAGLTEAVLYGSKKRLERDKELLTKDTAYTLERVSGKAYDTSKIGMSTRVALSNAVEPLEKLRDELNLSEADFLNISTILAQNTDFTDSGKQEDRMRYLKMLIKAHPNKSPVELIQIVLDSEDEIYKWFQSKTPEEIIEENLSSYYDKKRKKEIDTLNMLKQELPNIPEHILKETLLNNQAEIDQRIFLEKDKLVEKEYSHNLSYKVDIKPTQKAKSDDEIIKEVVKAAIENDLNNEISKKILSTELEAKKPDKTLEIPYILENSNELYSPFTSMKNDALNFTMPTGSSNTSITSPITPSVIKISDDKVVENRETIIKVSDDKIIENDLHNQIVIKIVANLNRVRLAQ